jgi:hypothetical protein
LGCAEKAREIEKQKALQEEKEWSNESWREQELADVQRCGGIAAG